MSSSALLGINSTSANAVSSIEVGEISSSASRTDSIAHNFFQNHSWLVSIAISGIITTVAILSLKATAGLAIGSCCLIIMKLSLAYFFPYQEITNSSESFENREIGNFSAPDRDQRRRVEVKAEPPKPSSFSPPSKSNKPDSSSSSAISSSILGTSSAREPLTPREYPIGINRRGMNCWANALFQLIMNCPNYRDALRSAPDRSRSGISIGQMIDQYLADQNGLRGVSAIETQNLREILSGKTTSISPDQNLIADLSHGFVALAIGWFPRSSFTYETSYSYDNLPAPHINQAPRGTNLEIRENNRFVVQRLEQLCFIPLYAGAALEDDLLNLMDNFFNSTSGFEFPFTHSGVRYPEIATKRRIQRAPEDLSFEFERVDRDNRKQITLHENISLKKSRHTLEEDADYVLDSFTVNTGAHCIAYIQKKGQWFECNDSNVTIVSREYALRAGKNSQVIHYRKI